MQGLLDEVPQKQKRFSYEVPIQAVFVSSIIQKIYQWFVSSLSVKKKFDHRLGGGHGPLWPPPGSTTATPHLQSGTINHSPDWSVTNTRMETVKKNRICSYNKSYRHWHPSCPRLRLFFILNTMNLMDIISYTYGALLKLLLLLR